MASAVALGLSTVALKRTLYTSISSENNGTWTIHCSGSVTTGAGDDSASNRTAGAEVECLTRQVKASRWYTSLTRIGLNCGPRFVGLGNISCSPAERVSVYVTDMQDQHEPYPLHPTTLDLMLQSWTVEFCRGEYRFLTQLFLPDCYRGAFRVTRARKVNIRSTSTGLLGTAIGSSFGVADGQVV